MCVRVSWVFRDRIAGSRGSSVFTFLKSGDTSLHFFGSVCGFQCPTSSLALGFRFFESSHSRGCEVVSRGLSPNLPSGGSPFSFPRACRTFVGLLWRDVSSDPLPILKSDSLSFYCYKSSFMFQILDQGLLSLVMLKSTYGSCVLPGPATPHDCNLIHWPFGTRCHGALYRPSQCGHIS